MSSPLTYSIVWYALASFVFFVWYVRRGGAVSDGYAACSGLVVVHKGEGQALI